jgi:hypothetical protein
MELVNQIVEAVLKDAVKDKVIVYGGRFQPFHKGHKKVYDALVSKFGSKNVYIASSDVQDSDKSPLSFNEKKQIATKLFGIPSSKFIKVKNPYQPIEILRDYDEKTTALIVAVGEKDNSRLGGAYFKPYKGDNKMKPYGVEAYVYTQLPSNSFGATDIRNMFRNKRLGDKKKHSEFERFFGKYDSTIYNTLDNKLNENVINESFDVLDALILAIIQGGVGLSIGALGSYLMSGGIVAKIKNWWKQHKNNSDVKRIVNKLKNDSDVKKALKNPNPKDIKNIVKNKISNNDLTHLKNLSEGLPGGAFIGLTSPQGYINGAPSAKKNKKKREENTNINISNTNNIPGGKADNLTLIDIAKKYSGDYYDYRNVLETVKEELKKGIKIELEHTSDIKLAAEIAKDHIAEDLMYYDKLAKIENPKEITEENPMYQPDDTDFENILDFEFADPATGRKMTIRQALKQPVDDFARQEAVRILRAQLALKHKSVGGNIGSHLFPPGEEEQPEVNLNLYRPYTKEDIDEASVKGSGYDEKTLDQMVKNPETGEMVKVRSALNYPKQHPAYQAAIKLVRQVNKNLPSKRVGKQKHPVAIKKTAAAKQHTAAPTQAKPSIQNRGQAQQPVVPTNNKPKQPSKVQPGAGQPQQPVQQNVPLDKVKKDIPSFNVSTKSDIDKITPKQQKEVSIKIDQLAQAAKDAKEKGEKAPNFNLCQITIPGTNLYCGGNKGIERAKMPQFKGKPTPGSEADKLPKDKDGEVDTEALFKKMLEDKGIKVSEPTSVPADQLKATQTELVGAKVAGMTKALEANPNHPGITAPIYVSSDGYVLDGHHRWAAVTSHEIASGRPANMNVRVIDMPIEELVNVSNQFAQDIGVQAKAADANTETPQGIQPTSTKEKDARTAGVGKVVTKAIQNPEIVKKAIKNNIKKWSEKERSFFRNGEQKPNSNTRRSIGETINAKIKGILPSIKKEMQHLGHVYGSAGEGIANLFSGKQLDDRQKDALKTLGKQVALSALGVALGPGIGHGAATFIGHLGGHLAEHIAGELALGGIGKAALFAGTEMEGDNEKYIEWFTLYFAQQMKEGEIPADVWENAIQDYNNDKEDGKIHEDDWDKPQQQNEVITEIEEDINVDVDKGDEILMGKFKNKKVIVKDLGKDQHGMPTINGKQATTFRKVDEGLILEGGAYGHMNHPFDIQMNLTFGDLKNIVNGALSGDLGIVREKTDGQALAVSWKNGRLIAARNKSHLANAGAGAMDAAQLGAKFGGRGALSDAYSFAVKDLENAIRGLSDKQKEKIFKNGKCFVNLEVIYPENANVIPYGQNLLVFHNVVEYNESGNAIGKVDGGESVLAGMIKQINAHIQSKYTIQGPPITTLPKNKELASKKGKFIGMISKLQKEFSLKDNDGVADYHQAWWDNFITKSKKNIDGVERAGLIKRWAFDDKNFRIANIKDNKAREWAEGIDKGVKTTIMAGNLRKFEDIFLGVGAEVLSFMGSVLTANPDSALQSMRKSLESTAQQIMNGGTITQIKKLEKELARLNAIGGFEKIVPNEGLVFFYKGNTYKLTGAFAPLNQILGIFKFSR